MIRSDLSVMRPFWTWIVMFAAFPAAHQLRGDTQAFFVEGNSCGEPEPGLLAEWLAEVGNSTHISFESAEGLDPFRDGYRLTDGLVEPWGVWALKESGDTLEIVFYEPGTEIPKPVPGVMVGLFNIGEYSLKAIDEAGDTMAEIAGVWGCEGGPGMERWAGFADPDGIARIEISHHNPTISDLFIAAGRRDTTIETDYLNHVSERSLFPGKVSLGSIATGEGVTVAAGHDDNHLLVSRSGSKWATISFDPMYRLRSVVYGNGDFVMVGKRHFFRSDDGIVWEVVARVEGHLNTVGWFRGRFWAVGGNTIWNSLDGRNWQRSDLTSDREAFDLAVFFDDGTLLHAISGAEGHEQWISADGISWGLSEEESNESLHHAVDLATDGSVALATARQPGSGPEGLANASRLLVKRAGGPSFEIIPPISGVPHWSAVEYRDGRFTLFSDQGIAETDSGFGLWKTDLKARSPGRIAVIASDQGWLAASENGHILTRSFESESDSLWRVVHEPPTEEPDLHKLVFGNGMFLILDRGRALFRSFSGHEWVALPLPNEENGELIFVRDRFLWLDQTGSPLQSVDGGDWAPLIIDPITDGVYSIAAGPDLWIALSRPSTSGPVEVYRSTDTVSWEKQSFVLAAGTDEIVHGNGVFVTSNLVSPDGITWTVHRMMREGIRFCGDEFLSHDDTGVYRSIDGLNWSYEHIFDGIRISDLLKVDGQTIVLAEMAGSWRFLVVPGGGEWWAQDPFYGAGDGNLESAQMATGWGTVLTIGRDPSVILQSDSVYPPAGLANLSTRSLAVPGPVTQVAGFVVGGSEQAGVLARCIGPGLVDFGIDRALQDPEIRLMNESGEVAFNDNWADADWMAKDGAFSETGAFPLAVEGLDAALVDNLEPGRYTVVVSDRAENGGVSLVEVYQLGAVRTMKNLSCRTYVGAGENVTIGGLVVSGQGTAPFLIRAVGPGLAGYGVDGVLSEPMLEVRRSETLIGSNQGWDDLSQAMDLDSAASRVGAFPLASGSADAAVLMTLPAGNYTATVSGVDGTEGIVLLEIYLVE